MSDDELRVFIRGVPRYEQTVATGVLTPLLDAVLKAPPAGWSAERLRKLSWLQWQAFLLATDAERMNECTRLTFTVAEHNLPIVRANHRKVVGALQGRLGIMLKGVRGALTDLDL